jgi:hypothetical protein
MPDNEPELAANVAPAAGAVKPLRHPPYPRCDTAGSRPAGPVAAMEYRENQAGVP